MFKDKFKKLGAGLDNLVGSAKDSIESAVETASDKLDDVRESVDSIKDAEYTLTNEELYQLTTNKTVTVNGPRGSITLKVSNDN